MATYLAVLPEVFPHSVLVLSDHRLHELINFLLSDDEVCPNGSSFAITANAQLGHRHLWLSQASMERLFKHERFGHIFRVMFDPTYEMR